MTLHPEVMTKAQQEIDTVIGNQRLPTLDDRASLPYIEAMLSECLRYACPAPLSKRPSMFSGVVIDKSLRSSSHVDGG